MRFRLAWAWIFCGWCATVNLVSAQAWQATGAPNNRWFAPACSADGTKLVAVAGNYLLASTNSGWNWFTNGAPSNNWTCVASSADGVKLVATAAVIYNPAGGGAYGGPVYTSTDSGKTWSPTSAPNNQWSWVASSADGSRLVAAAAYDDLNTAWGSIYLSTNSGASWTVSSAPTNVWNCVASSADGTRLVASARAVFISTNAGATWTSNSISADFPAGNPPSWNSVASSADGASLMGIRALGFYSGTNVPRVYTSTNFGDTWTAKDLPTVGSGFVALSADGNVMMASKGHLYISTDRGVTWTQNTIPGQQYGWGHGCVASSADGNKLFLALGADDFGQPNSIYTAYTAPRPQLSFRPAATNLALCWMVPATNFVVQQRPGLNAGSWVTLTNPPTFNPSNLQNQIILAPTNSSSFFRLMAR